MQVYNTKDWLAVFRLTSSDTLWKLFPLIVFITLYTLGIAYLEIEYFKLSDKSWIKNTPIMHTLLGFAISMLLVFRTNTAYDRWWEGRKLWGGLVNNSRNLALKLDAMVSDTTVRSFFRRTIPLYAEALKTHLQSEVTRFMLDEKEHPELAEIDAQKHIPNQLAAVMFEKVNTLYKEGKITGNQLIILNGELSAFTDICGACERIKNTPIPYSYSVFIKTFILVYVITLPFGLAFTLGYIAAPIVAIIFYVLASLELVAEEIEEPFGHDTNDLPMAKIAANIKKHVEELL